MEAKAKSDPIALLQEWYREVLQRAAFVEATNCDTFLRVYMTTKRTSSPRRHGGTEKPNGG
jgi:hypothetical protein